MTFRRNNVDFMNSFFVNTVTAAFTNIEEIWTMKNEDKEAQQQQITLAQIKLQKDKWHKDMTDLASKDLDKLEKVFITNMDAYKGLVKNGSQIVDEKDDGPQKAN